MEEIINKRKIKLVITLEGKYIHKKSIESNSSNVKPLAEVVKEEIQENNLFGKNISKPKISPFQLVVIKLPWYKRAIRSLLNLFGLYYEP